MAIILPNSASHWYRRDGSPSHTQPYKDKKRAAAGERRSTTVRDAREQGLLPSVTNVLNIMSNPMITVWGREQVLLLAAQNPRSQGETDEDYVRKIESLFQAKMDLLREIGHRTHSAMQDHAHGMPVRPDDYDQAELPIDCGRAWFNNRVRSVQHTERVMVSSKYAGTLDLVCELDSGNSPGGQVTIVDYKTRSSGWSLDKTGRWKCATYSADILQLAAYRGALCEQVGFPYSSPLIDCVSVILPSAVPPGPKSSPRPEAYEKRYTMEELTGAKKTFDSILNVWCNHKNYHP
jgi:hypothetical protein